MKITVKMKDDTIVICSKCHWSGAIEDGHWMQETEFGYCPKCGSSEFDDLETWEQVKYDDQVHQHPSLAWAYEWTGWKARAFVYLLMVFVLLFGLVPWVWGWCSFFKWVF